MAESIVAGLVAEGVTRAIDRGGESLRRKMSTLSQSSRLSSVNKGNTSSRLGREHTMSRLGSENIMEEEDKRAPGEALPDSGEFCDNDVKKTISTRHSSFLSALTDTPADADNAELDQKDDVDAKSEEKEPTGMWGIIIGHGIALAFLVAASIGSYYISSNAGIYALGSMCEEMQNSVMMQIQERILGNMDPLRIYLQTGVKMFEENGFDLSTWSDLERTLAYQHNFLDTYLDESRCCSAVFVNMEYDHVADGVDDVLQCHAFEAPDCTHTMTGSMEGEIAMANLTGNAVWAGVLHYSESYTAEFRAKHGDKGNIHHGDFAQVLPGDINGAPNNTLTFKYYEKQSKMAPWQGDANIQELGSGECDEERCFRDKSDGHLATPIGFVHWPIQDGYWYHEVQKHNMQRGDVRSAPRVFPWTLYPPAVLKIHMFTPVYNPQGKRVGGFNVGFKVHWLSQFLSGLRMDGDCMSQGCFCFIVERETGHLVATSDPSIKVLTNEDTTNGEPIKPIKALESLDIRVAAIAKEVVDANGGDWMDVHSFKSRSDVEVEANLVNLALERMAVSKPFIMTSDFKRMSGEPMNSTVTDVPFGIDWIILLSVPEKVVMDSINDKKAKNTGILVGYSAGLWAVEQFILPLLIVALAGSYVAWFKKKNSPPPSSLSRGKESKENEEEV